MNLGGCIEATPAVWKGRIYIGSRAGHLYTLGVASSLACGASTLGLARCSVASRVGRSVVVVVVAAVMSTGSSCQRYSRRLRPLSMTCGGQLAADVPEVPRLVVVAGALRGIEGVAEQEAVLVGVGGDPLAGGRGAPRLVDVGLALGGDVDRRAELVLGVPGPGDPAPRLRVAELVDPPLVELGLALVAAVAGDDAQRRAVGGGRLAERAEVVEHQLSDGHARR